MLKNIRKIVEVSDIRSIKHVFKNYKNYPKGESWDLFRLMFGNSITAVDNCTEKWIEKRIFLTKYMAKLNNTNIKKLLIDTASDKIDNYCNQKEINISDLINEYLYDIAENIFGINIKISEHFNFSMLEFDSYYKYINNKAKLNELHIKYDIFFKKTFNRINSIYNKSYYSNNSYLGEFYGKFNNIEETNFEHVMLFFCFNRIDKNYH